MDDEIRTDEQFWEDFRETIREARQLLEWKRRYRVMIYDEEGSNLVRAFKKERKG